jgi:IclR family pca regulon transcriptional regulator
MEQLAQEVKESTSLSVLDDLDIVYVARVPVRRIMTVALGVGARLPAYAASMGRVLLASLPGAELEERLLRADLRPLTPATIWQREPLKEELRKVRRQGYAIVMDELEVGLCSIAVPIHDRSGQVAGALNIGSRTREGIQDWALSVALPALRETQEKIELTLANQHTSLAQ